MTVPRTIGTIAKGDFSHVFAMAASTSEQEGGRGEANRAGDDPRSVSVHGAGAENRGAATPATSAELSRNKTTHRWPEFLLDGRHLLYVASTPFLRLMPADDRDNEEVLQGATEHQVSQRPVSRWEASIQQSDIWS